MFIRVSYPFDITLQIVSLNIILTWLIVISLHLRLLVCRAGVQNAVQPKKKCLSQFVFFLFCFLKFHPIYIFPPTIVSRSNVFVSYKYLHGQLFCAFVDHLTEIHSKYPQVSTVARFQHYQHHIIPTACSLQIQIIRSPQIQVQRNKTKSRDCLKKCYNQLFQQVTSENLYDTLYNGLMQLSPVFFQDVNLHIYHMHLLPNEHKAILEVFYNWKISPCPT